MNSKNDNDKVNIPSFPSPEPTVSYFDDLAFLKDFKNEFPTIVYNDALTSKSDSSTEPVEIPRRIDEFDLKTKTSLSECDEKEQNILYFNDLFPFIIIYPNDLKSDKDNDDDKIDIKQSLGGNDAIRRILGFRIRRIDLLLSAVTYTSVYTDSEPGRVFWGADKELSDGGSPRVIVYGYDGFPMMLVAPSSPDYIPCPQEPQTPPVPQDEDEHELMFIQPHDHDFVLEPIYPEYIPLEDEHILSAEEQPLPPVDGPVDYPMDGGDDGDNDDDGNSSGYDADDEDEDNEDEEEEEEHLTSADSAVVIPIDELTSISLSPEAEVERLLAMPTPSPSPLTSLSPPSARERLARCTAPAALPSPPLPPFSYPPPPVDRRDGISESEQPPRKRLCLSTLGSREVGYGIRDTWIDPVEAVPDMASTTLENVNTRVVELAELHEHDTKDLYALLEQIIAPVTRQGQNPPPPNTNTPPHHITPKSVQAMIDQALLRNSTNGDGSQSL
nr:hypothetical protein [Tanacetum cinerariifolium]